MKSIVDMTQAELGAHVQSHLRSKGIEVVLSGGAVVAIYSHQRYVSKDLDLVNIFARRFDDLRNAMQEIGFHEQGRHFSHPDTQFIIEFPPGPLTIGSEPVGQIIDLEYDTGTLRLISPSDCVKDRLAAYYHWGDRQCLIQAIWVAQIHEIDLAEVRRWSISEDKLSEFEEISHQLRGEI
jgi:hypothetical protein